MTVQIPGFCVDQQYPFWYMRKMMSALSAPVVVSPSTDLVVSPSSGLQVQVTSGSAFVQQTINIEGGSVYNGNYLLVNDATTNPVNTITSPVSHPRIDQVIFRAYDAQEQGFGGSSKGQVEWLPGTESSSASLSTMGPGLSNPGAAAMSANSMQLAYVLQTVGESSISAANILDVRPRTHGSTNISASQSTSSTTFTTLATPDQVTGIVLPTNGIIRVRYWATWQESVAGGARAAIFIGNNQLKTVFGTNVVTQAAANDNIGTTGVNFILHSSLIGLVGGLSDGSGIPYAGDVSTGQALGAVIGGTSGWWADMGGTLSQIGGIDTADSLYIPMGGDCDIKGLPSGTYTVSVQFKATSGSVTASARNLWVQAISFA